MSSDHYAQHLIQKYRLAVAVGIIQTKPEAKSLDQHITDMKNKINDDKIDEFAIYSDDFDMDFDDDNKTELDDHFTQVDITELDDHLSEHSETILKDFNDTHLIVYNEFGHASEQNVEGDFVDLTEDDMESHVQTRNDVNDIFSTFCETQAQPEEIFTDIDKTFCDSIDCNNIISFEEACNSDAKTYKANKNILKNQSIDTDHTYCRSTAGLNKTANAENSFCGSITNTNNKKRIKQAKYIKNKNIDKQNSDQTTAYDSQATELYTVHTLTEDYTHLSQSQINNINISNKYIKGIRKTNENLDAFKSIEDSLPMHVIDVNLVEKINRNLSKMNNTKLVDTYVQNTSTNITSGLKNKKKSLDTNAEFGYNFKDINSVKKISKKLNESNVSKAMTKENDVTNIIDSKKIEKNILNAEENATNTEFEYIFKNINLARKICNNLGRQEDLINIAIDTDNCDVSQVDLNPRDFNSNNSNTIETQVLFTDENPDQPLSNKLETNMNEITSVHEIAKTNDENMSMQVFDFSKNVEDGLFNKKKSIAINTDENNVNDFTNENSITYVNTGPAEDVSKTNFISSEYTTMQVLDFDQNGNNKAADVEITKTNVENTETMQVFDFEENIPPVDSKIDEDYLENESISSEEVSELVPFKVMEELNRIKAFLNRRVERRIGIDSSLDSGYRSDSQGRSQGALQLSGNWIGQSAYCLYEHITMCPMVSTTQQIVEEVSQALGQLIDKLHEEETYPAFLEELLHNVDSLIRSIFSDDDMLLEKDEKIQRLFLLNKSIHIQKYTIDKLTVILENIHANFTAQEDLFELTNTQEVENLSYIFHVLEVIIKNSLKHKKKINSQSQTQNSEVYKKKQSISDIWRKKWNPNYKEETKFECGLDKMCIFTKCSVVLNKIVVGFLDGYSLVAYAALQCFNLLQS